MDFMSPKEHLKEIALENGAVAFGVCRVEELVERFHPEIRESARRLPFAISIGMVLQKAVLETIIDRPNEIYKAHYRGLNTQLEQITYKLVQEISRRGNGVMPIPVSKVLNRYPMIAHVNHREIALKAGLGWCGKNNLLINPAFGSRLRLATVLTDLKLEPDAISESDCGQCKACQKRCPAGAIGETVEQFDLEKCSEQVIRFSRKNNYGHLICGLCLNCCPGDHKSRKKNA
jgi:epoxyqueuosine reductase QueG